MRLIGLHSRMLGGKDTCFETIRQEAENNSMLALRRAFADPLKVSGMRSLGFNEPYDGGPEVTRENQVFIANQIKETGRVFISWVGEDGTLRAKAITGRNFWQFYGTEAHRADDLGASFGIDFWVDNLLPLGAVSVPGFGELESATTRPLFWDNFKESWAGFADIGAVTDVRFANEAKRILELDGEVWRIDSDSRLGENADLHVSERPLPDELITRTIDNNSTLAAFQQNILEALHS